MKNGKKIVRTKTVHKNDIGDYFEIQVMTYAKFIQRSQYKFVETDFILFPYKWYDLRWLVDKPYFFLKSYTSLLRPWSQKATADQPVFCPGSSVTCMFFQQPKEYVNENT